MYLSEFRLLNYKSFLDSGPIALKPGINVLTGQNNAGKTALLEALSLRFTSKGHRSMENAPAATSQVEGTSRAFFSVAATREEFRAFLLRVEEKTSLIPVRKAEFPKVEDGEALRWALLRADEVVLDFHYSRAQAPEPHSAWAFSGEDAGSRYHFLSINRASREVWRSLLEWPEAAESRRGFRNGLSWTSLASSVVGSSRASTAFEPSG